jgi:NADPH:quinone reductase-like Zn-dependent oxidoreductase
VFVAVDKLVAAHAKKALKADGHLHVDKASGGMGPGREHGPRIAELLDMVNNGALRSVIDHTYAMDDIVQAHTCVQRRHKRGNVVVTWSQERVAT